ncbi:DMT family transporter [Phytomonospora sp. NPDC050363]|uniref:DMT family transporter n=1 Tax=Phytomonospora sp. NPDC050363 TaxID=3155642 RepID=UPI0033D5C95F
MTAAVLSALAGALCLALGAALQERVVVEAADGGRPRLLLALARDRRWIAGAAASIAGVGLHLFALSSAPVSLVQPLGVSGLLFAVGAAAILARRRVLAAEITGALLVTLGLGALVLAMPHHTGAEPSLSATTAIALCAAAAGTVLLGLAFAGRLRPTGRALLLAGVAGVSFGAVSAFARVLGSAARRDPSTLLHWHTAAAIALAVLGGLAVQHAYRSGRFTLAFATLLLADPVAAAGIGLAFLGEPFPSGRLGLAGLLCSAALILPGVVLLARTRRPAGAAAPLPHGEPHVAARS